MTTRTHHSHAGSRSRATVRYALGGLWAGVFLGFAAAILLVLGLFVWGMAALTGILIGALVGARRNEVT